MDGECLRRKALDSLSYGSVPASNLPPARAEPLPTPQVHGDKRDLPSKATARRFTCPQPYARAKRASFPAPQPAPLSLLTLLSDSSPRDPSLSLSVTRSLHFRSTSAGLNPSSAARGDGGKSARRLNAGPRPAPGQRGDYNPGSRIPASGRCAHCRRKRKAAACLGEGGGSGELRLPLLERTLRWVGGGGVREGAQESKEKMAGGTTVMGKGQGWAQPCCMAPTPKSPGIPPLPTL